MGVPTDPSMKQPQWLSRNGLNGGTWFPLLQNFSETAVRYMYSGSIQSIALHTAFHCVLLNKKYPDPVTALGKILFKTFPVWALRQGGWLGLTQNTGETAGDLQPLSRRRGAGGVPGWKSKMTSPQRRYQNWRILAKMTCQDSSWSKVNAIRYQGLEIIAKLGRVLATTGLVRLKIGLEGDAGGKTEAYSATGLREARLSLAEECCVTLLDEEPCCWTTSLGWSPLSALGSLCPTLVLGLQPIDDTARHTPQIARCYFYVPTA